MGTVAPMTTFTAMTYNVLAQAYVHPDRYPLSPAEALDPARRRDLLLTRIRALDADLLCLQELEPASYDGVRTLLDATHDSEYVPRGRRPEGVAVFARRGPLTRYGHHVVHFDAHRPGDDDLALVVSFTVDGRPLHVACTHLTWQPDSTPPAEHLGHRQMVELLAHRDATAPDDTWIFAGDFNATSTSVVLTAARERGMDESCRTQRPWDTVAIGGRPRKLDYLLYSAGRLDPRPGTLPALTPHTALPSLTEPSDHLPLLVEFTPVP
jgi:mRNA deadenylase 3'-5' endonuclease subunit Ccr4